MNQAARRKPGRSRDWIGPEWGWAWPANRRILYNRASADPEGRPWSERKALSGGTRSTASGPATTCRLRSPTKPPDYRPPAGATGTTRSAGDDPFIMQADGRGVAVRARRAWPTARCRRTTSRRSPRSQPAVRRQQRNPARQVFWREDNPLTAERPGDRLAGVPLRGDHVPADRALHRRRHEPLARSPYLAWHEARRELPFVFTGSAAASGGGLRHASSAPVAEAGPARRLAAAGAAAELIASRLIDRRPGLATEAYTTGRAHRLRRSSEYLTLGGAVLAVSGARRSRLAAVAGGLALLAGSALKRFGTFEAGVASTKDPKYVVVPQREGLEAADGERHPPT